MSPLFFDGDFIIATTLFSRKKLRPGDIIIFKHPLGILIKEVVNVSDTVSVRGINLLSTTSDKLGKISFDNIIAKKIFSIKKKRN